MTKTNVSVRFLSELTVLLPRKHRERRNGQPS